MKFFRTKKVRLKNLKNLKKILKKSEGPRFKIHLFTCEKSILAHSSQASLQRSIFLLILVNKDQPSYFIINNGNLFWPIYYNKS